MPKQSLTRRRLLAAAAPLAAAPAIARIGFDGDTAEAAAHDHAGRRSPSSSNRHMGHAVMIGAGAPAVGGPHDLDDLLYPPPTLPYERGRVREYTLTAIDKEIEIAPGVFFPAWTYNGTVPGPVIRATEGDTLRVKLVNAGSHPHTIHFHGIHPTTMDGVFEIVPPGGELTYQFEARPAAMHLYHCHATPLKKHIAKGLYGALIIDPEEPRAPAQELVLVMNGYDTDGDGDNNFYTVNGRTFYYARYPITVKRSQLLRIYLANHNVTEGLGIAAPVAEGGSRPRLGRLAALALLAGGPAIVGTWIGGYVTSDILGVLFFALAAGAAFQVVVEVSRFVARRAPGGLTSGHAVGGFLAGVGIMYLTGLLAG